MKNPRNPTNPPNPTKASETPGMRARTWVILPSMRLIPLFLSGWLAAVAQAEPPAAEAGRGGRGGAANEPIGDLTFSALRARNIGPAFVSGRISQIAMFPGSSDHYLVALASGNIFSTTNN